MSDVKIDIEIPKFIRNELENIIKNCGGNFDLSREYFNKLADKYIELCTSKSFPQINKGSELLEENEINEKDDIPNSAIIGWFNEFFKNKKFIRITETKPNGIEQKIDKISFLYLMYKFGIENRKKINKILGLADKYNANFIGIPSTKQGTYTIIDKQNDDLFNIINSIKNADEIINLFDVKDKKKLLLTNKSITLGGFMLYPEHVLPLDAETEKLLSSLGFKVEIAKPDDYKKLLKDIKKAFGYDSLSDNQKKYFFNALSYMGYKLKEMTKLNELLTLNKNVILYGAPGTSKTHTVLNFINSQKDCESKFCQFHASFTYEDFMEGFKPVSKGDSMQLEIRNGVFKDFVKRAIKNYPKKFYFIIDEINRAELSRVFGELLYCIEYRIKYKYDENDKTWNKEGDEKGMIETQYNSYLNSLEDGKEKEKLSIFGTEDMRFGIPDNVYIIGTMNSIDRSVDSIDMAMRRRFVWHEMKFDKQVLVQEFNDFEQKDKDAIINFAEKINKKIKDIPLSSEYEIGHTYFLKIEKYLDTEKNYTEAINKLWELNIKPLIREYLRTVFSSNEIETELSKIYNPEPKKSNQNG